MSLRFNLPKNYGVNEYCKRPPYLSNNTDLAFQNSITEDLQKFLLATMDFLKKIQENLSTIVTDGKLNNVIVIQALDLTDKSIFDTPNPLQVIFKDI